MHRNRRSPAQRVRWWLAGRLIATPAGIHAETWLDGKHLTRWLRDRYDAGWYERSCTIPPERRGPRGRSRLGCRQRS